MTGTVCWIFSTITIVMQFVLHKRLKAVGNEQGVSPRSYSKTSQTGRVYSKCVVINSQ